MVAKAKNMATSFFAYSSNFRQALTFSVTNEASCSHGTSGPSSIFLFLLFCSSTVVTTLRAAVWGPYQTTPESGCTMTIIDAVYRSSLCEIYVSEAAEMRATYDAQYSEPLSFLPLSLVPHKWLLSELFDKLSCCILKKYQKLTFWWLFLEPTLLLYENLIRLLYVWNQIKRFV